MSRQRSEVRGPAAQRLLGTVQRRVRGPNAAIFGVTGRRKALDTSQAGEHGRSWGFEEEGKGAWHLDTCWELLGAGQGSTRLPAAPPILTRGAECPGGRARGLSRGGGIYFADWGSQLSL